MATARARFLFTATDKTQSAAKSVRRNVSSVEKSFTKLQKSADRTGKAIRRQFRQAEVSLNKLGAAATRAGRDMSLKVTAPALAMGAGILKVAGDFESAMNRVQVKTGATGEQFQKLRDQAKQLGATTQFSANQAAQGQEILATAGFKADQILAALPGTLDLAAAGQLELAEAATFVSRSLNGFGEDASQAGKYADILAKGSLLADQTVRDLGLAMGKAASTAASFGIGAEETAASLSALAQKGRVAEEGGTAFRNFLAELASPASKARQAVERLGYSLTNADGSLKSVSEILRTFNAAGINAGNSAAYFEKRVGDTYRILDRSQDSLTTWTEQLGNAGGTAAEVAAANLKGLSGELTKLKSALEGVAIAIADAGLLAWATELVQKVTAVVSNLATANPEFLRLGTLIAGAAAAIGPLLLGFGAIASSLGSIAGLPALFSAISATVAGLAAAVSGPVLVAFAALAAVIVALVTAWRNGERWIRAVGELLNQVGQDISATLAPVLRIVGNIFTQLLLPALKTVGEAIITSLAVGFRIASTVIRVVLGPLLEKLAEWLGQVLPRVIDVAKKAWDGFVRFVRKAAEALLNTLAAALGFLAKIPGAIGEAFQDGADKLGEFAAAVGDLETPIGEAVASVTQFAADVEDSAPSTNPWDNLIAKIRELTTVAGAPIDIPTDTGVPETREDAPDVTEDEGATQGPKKALLNLKKLGETTARSLEQNLATAILSIRNPIQAVTELFKNLWTAVIQEIARQIAIKLAAKLVGFALGGPLGFLAGFSALTQDSGPSVGASQTLGQTPAGGVVYQVNNYNLLPGQTADRVRAGRVVTQVDRQAKRLILGPQVA